MKKLVLLLPVILLLFGCAPKQPNAILQLQYHGTNASSAPRKAKIAILEASFTANDPYSKLMRSPLIQMAAMHGSGTPLEVSLTSTYFTNYAGRLSKTLTSDLETILVEKGFSVYGKYDSYDAIPYAAKKDIDLLIVPTFDFAPVVRNNVVNTPFIGLVDKGDIQLVGRVELYVSEPLSRERLVTKKIDVATSISNYSNTAEAHNALINLLNTTYPTILSKAAMLLDGEEVDGLIKHSHEIKSKKVY